MIDFAKGRLEKAKKAVLEGQWKNNPDGSYTPEISTSRRKYWEALLEECKADCHYEISKVQERLDESERMIQEIQQMQYQNMDSILMLLRLGNKILDKLDAK